MARSTDEPERRLTNISPAVWASRDPLHGDRHATTPPAHLPGSAHCPRPGTFCAREVTRLVAALAQISRHFRGRGSR